MQTLMQAFERVDLQDQVSSSHRNHLQKSLEPELRVKSLHNLDWIVMDFEEHSLALPDSIAISHSERFGALPLSSVPTTETNGVFFPISSQRAVCAGHYSSDPVLEVISNNAQTLAAMCSWDHLVVHPRSPLSGVLHRQMGLAIRSTLKAEIDDAVQEIIEEAVSS